MKRHIQLLLVIMSMLTMAQAEDGMLPPKELRAEWSEIEEIKFADWSIKKFLGWAIPFDGGSKVFSFESDGDERFELMVATPQYWTPEDKNAKRQVFMIVHKNRFYRIEPQSKEEKNMIEKLTQAAEHLTGEGKRDPKLLISLAGRLGSREPIFKIQG